MVVGVPDGERYGVRSHVVVRASSRHRFQSMVELNDRVAVRIGLKREILANRGGIAGILYLIIFDPLCVLGEIRMADGQIHNLARVARLV